MLLFNPFSFHAPFPHLSASLGCLRSTLRFKLDEDHLSIKTKLLLLLTVNVIHWKAKPFPSAIDSPMDTHVECLCCSLASFLPRSRGHGWQSLTPNSHTRVGDCQVEGGSLHTGFEPRLCFDLNLLTRECSSEIKQFPFSHFSVDSRMLFRDLTD